MPPAWEGTRSTRSLPRWLAGSRDRCWSPQATPSTCPGSFSAIPASACYRFRRPSAVTGAGAARTEEIQRCAPSHPMRHLVPYGAQTDGIGPHT